MSGKTNKRLRRAARRRSGSADHTILAVSPDGATTRVIDLYKQYKKLHGRLPWNKREKALSSLGG